MGRAANPSDRRSLETDGGERERSERDPRRATEWSDGGERTTDRREPTVEIDTTETRSWEGGDDERFGDGSATKQRLGEDEVYCWSCGVPIRSAAEICPECGVRQRPPPSYRRKSPGLAALASAVWTGAGQIYNGEIAKGIGLMALMFVSTLLIFVLVGIVTTPLIWAYAIYDAYRTAERIDQRPFDDEF